MHSRKKIKMDFSVCIIPAVEMLFIINKKRAGVNKNHSVHIFDYAALLTGSLVFFCSVITTGGASSQAQAAKHCVTRGLWSCSTACPLPLRIRQKRASHLSSVAFWPAHQTFFFFCRPVAAGVQRSLEGPACCDQVWCWRSSAEQRSSSVCEATGDEPVW